MRFWFNLQQGNTNPLEAGQLDPVDLRTDSTTWIETSMETDRIYQGEDELWYFNVRGNLPMGPFATYHDARDALSAQLFQWQRALEMPTFSNPLRQLKLGRQRHREPRHL